MLPFPLLCVNNRRKKGLLNNGMAARTLSIAEQFALMSAERDKPVESETEAKGYATQNGYVHEIVSKSPNRQIITKRVTVTQSDPSSAHQTVTTAPKFEYARYSTPPSSSRSSDVPTPPVGMSRPLPRQDLGPQRSVIVGEAIVGNSTPPSEANSFQTPTAWRPTPVPSFSPVVDPPAPSPVTVESLGSVRWVKTIPSPKKEVTYTPSALHQQQGNSPYVQKSVRIGGVSNTTLVEPTRVSPVMVKEVYAPVRYVSKRELRAMRQQHLQVDDDAPKVRHGSVPRLDSYLEEQMLMQHQGREFCPQHGLEDMSELSERRSSAGRPGSRNSNRGSPPPPFDGRSAGQQPRQPYYDEREDQWESVSERGSVHSMARTPHRSPAPAPYYQSPVISSEQRGVTTVRDLPNDFHVLQMAEMIAFSRNLTVIPEPPPQCNDAFRLLHRGTYVVKYGRVGNPHERFLAMRLVASERTQRPQPFLLWSLHSEASSFKDKLHLAYLSDVVPGVQSTANFHRHLLGPNRIVGPNVNGKKSVLPTTWAFSLVFESNGLRRTVDCLCLDEQTFHCWLLVAQYFATINRSSPGDQRVIDADTLAPDSPRSVSTASGF